MRTSTFSRIVKAGLHVFGVWPYLPSTLVCQLYWIIALSTAQVFQYGYVVYSNPESFSEFMDGVSSAMASTLLFSKLGILWANQKKFGVILRIMTSDWQSHTSSHQSKSIMINASFLARRVSRIIILMQFFSVFFYSLGVLVANAGDPEKWEPYNRELILKMKFPFEINTHPIYVAVTVIQFIHLMFVGWGITVVNTLFVTLSLDEPNAAAILVKCFMFYVTMNLDVFIYCYAGEYLSAKSKLIGDAAYNSLWYNVAAKDSEMMVFVILRSQKRLTITCGKIMELSLERFTSVVKASASYMSVLMAMY
ncbi:PREDICTED: uncharacterized protein LOC106747210 [Dinoponera quadriceps]|uniref:Uncharacterized protein LOC106747210 n=1 Tax=Dinoponera quadriceps TaxID=609295 RepID=A0A6P3XPA7_DINQU|nr:PREDICTED: uncharacterized protein LOC106747210 [Dinoponera quadriceps]